MSLTTITFFERFVEDILAGRKTITIRDDSECDYIPGSVVQVATFEDNDWFCAIKILSVQPIEFADLDESHAMQENMTLTQLKQVIGEIYPNTSRLYVINFSLME